MTEAQERNRKYENRALLDAQALAKANLFTAEDHLNSTLREMQVFSSMVGLPCRSKQAFKAEVIPALAARANAAIEAVNVAMPWNRSTNRPL